MLRRIRQVFPARLSFDTLEDGFIPSLEGLRGLAILMVIAYHYARSYFPIGWAGVDLFFVLSGFLITRILLNAKAENKGARHYFKNFYARRTLRIFPLYYAFLFFILFVPPLFLGAWYDEKSGFYIQNQGWFWTYMENWLFAFRGWGETTLLSHFWSLAIEEQFYLFWPFLVYFLSSKQALRISIVFIVVSLISRNLSYGWDQAPLFGYTATVSRLDALGVGCLLAILLNMKKQVLELVLVPVIIIVGLILLSPAIILYTTDYRDPYFIRAGDTVLAIFFGGLLLLTLSDHPKNRVRQIFSSEFFRWLGRYSYGLYVIHYPAYYCIEAYVYRFYPGYFGEWWVKAGIAAAGLVITIPVVLLSYRFLELPFLRLKRYFV